MKVYWKDWPDAKKYELLAEPAARCFTMTFTSHRWEIQCLGAATHFSGNFDLAAAKRLALDWFKVQLGHLVTAVDVLRG